MDATFSADTGGDGRSRVDGEHSGATEVEPGVVYGWLEERGVAGPNG